MNDMVIEILGKVADTKKMVEQDVDKSKIIESLNEILNYFELTGDENKELENELLNLRTCPKCRGQLDHTMKGHLSCKSCEFTTAKNEMKEVNNGG